MYNKNGNRDDNPAKKYIKINRPGIYQVSVSLAIDTSTGPAVPVAVGMVLQQDASSPNDLGMPLGTTTKVCGDAECITYTQTFHSLHAGDKLLIQVSASGSPIIRGWASDRNQWDGYGYEYSWVTLQMISPISS